jgi:hypothetical protein
MAPSESRYWTVESMSNVRARAPKCDDGGVAFPVVGAAVKLIRIDVWVETEYTRRLEYPGIKI